MFFKKDLVILILNSNSLTLVSKSSAKKIAYSHDIIKYQEVIDLTSFESSTKKLLQSSNLKNPKSIIVLANDLIYEKQIILKDRQNIDDLVETFINEVPFKTENISKIHIKEKEGYKVLLTNKSLYSKLVNVLEKSDWKVSQVMPATVLGVDFNIKNSNYDQLTQLIKKIEINKFNFLDLSIEKPEIKNAKVKNEKLSLLSNFKIAIPLILFLFSIPVYLLFSAGIIPKFWQKQNVQIQEQQVETDVQTFSNTLPVTDKVSEKEKNEENEVAKITKENLVIKVLNGSGVAGQAGEIKAELELLGFVNISTANAEDPGEVDSIIIFNENVSEEIKAEVIEIVTPFVDKIKQVVDNSINENIIITTR